MSALHSAFLLVQTALRIIQAAVQVGRCAFQQCIRLESITIGSGVTFIGNLAFGNTPELISVYYMGTSDDWNGISMSSDNDSLTDTTIYYYSETQPADGGNYWHYIDGEIVVW